MTRFRGTVEYDGHDFYGWQRQSGRRTVQGVLEDALAEVTGAPTAVVGAGRTDVGVHAVGQVVHFDSLWEHADGVLQRALNAVLPRDVALVSVGVAPDDFHARYSAVRRSYRYALWRGAVRSPLRRRTSLHVPHALSVAAMTDAAARFVGAHDLAAFGTPPVRGGTTVRRIDRCAVEAEGPELWIEVDGNAFLRHQVRRMVGVLLDVGRGWYPPEAVGRALSGEVAAVRPRRVPAHGLTLMAVHYPSGADGVDGARVDMDTRTGSGR